MHCRPPLIPVSGMAVKLQNLISLCREFAISQLHTMASSLLTVPFSERKHEFLSA